MCVLVEQWKRRRSHSFVKNAGEKEKDIAKYGCVSEIEVQGKLPSTLREPMNGTPLKVDLAVGEGSAVVFRLQQGTIVPIIVFRFPPTTAGFYSFL